MSGDQRAPRHGPTELGAETLAVELGLLDDRRDLPVEPGAVLER